MLRFKIVLTILGLLAISAGLFTGEVKANASAYQTQYGFGISVTTFDPLQDITRFKLDVDDSVVHRQQWIRTSIDRWDVAPSGSSSGQINWNYQNLAVYDEAIDYAYQKGLKIAVVTGGAPDWASFWGNNYSFEDYQKVSVNYWGFLAQRYKGKIAIWQIFNEANGSHYRYYTPLTSLTHDYLSQLDTLLALARQTIQQADPAAHITTNSLGWPMNDQQQSNWFQYFDAIGSNLDEISLDMYPVDNIEEINKLGTRVSDTIHRYSKPVIIGEIGFCTDAAWGENAEQLQKQLLPLSINQLKTGLPYVIFVYMMRDRGTVDLPSADGMCGIKYNDGRLKPGYSAVMEAMTNQAELPGDFDHDGQVDILDLRQLLPQFVTIFDYNILVGNFGR